MIDMVGGALAAVAARSALAYPLAVAAGIVTSIGPCAAPRYIAVAACAHAARRPWAIVAAFACGLVCAYVALGVAAGAIGALWAASAALYASMAAALAVSGIVTLARAGGGSHSHETQGRGIPHRYQSAGGVFLLGASSALVVSPCCTPVVAGIAALTLTSGHGADGVALLAAFACGHALPVLTAGALGTRLSGALRRVATSQAPSIVAGSLMLALGAYYGVLA
ncbi:MAG: Cytochrome biosis protein transrane region [Candidatus Eremiobacteraeota bacterium]|nr:Cytochrome biosis protein transrane region [Candidatus Eremiobacteraeota bacterium]